MAGKSTTKRALKAGLAEGAPHYHGHRERLRARFREAGAEAVSDYELLELVLFRAIPQRDVKPLAKALIAQVRLVRRGGGGAAGAAAARSRASARPPSTELKIVQAAASRLARGAGQEAAGAVVVVERCSTIAAPRMAFADKEQFRILFLDKRNQLIADELQQTGTVDHTPVYPREVVKRALELSATALILVHNHPSGDPTPSRADIQMTQAIVEIAKPLGIAVHDHIIVGKEGHASFKGLKLI